MADAAAACFDCMMALAAVALVVGIEVAAVAEVDFDTLLAADSPPQTKTP